MIGDGVMDAIGSEDPLDRADFDPIAYLNHLFPTERSLDGLDPFAAKISAQISMLDTEISLAVQAQSEAGQQAVRDVAEARAAIAELFEKVRDIKGKAEQSEVMVQEICRDIRQLDHAKRHLQTTITALKRLHMLVTAVDQLEEVSKRRHYRDAANLLDAVRQLLTHFQPYAEVPRIAELGNRVNLIKRDLTVQIDAAFRAVGQLAPSSADLEALERPPNDIPGQFKNLHDACLVVDALGSKARRQQVSVFCKQQLANYDMIFLSSSYVGSEGMGPENLDRRFLWFWRLMRSIEVRCEGVFPAHWHLHQKVCLAFLDKTRASLLEDLSKNSGAAAQDVQSLLKKLQKCLNFEKEARDRFETPSLTDQTKLGHNISGEFKSDIQILDGGSAAPTSKLISLSKDGQGIMDEEEEPHLPIMGMLSGVFDPYMDPYIALEKRKLGEVISTSASNGKGKDAEDIDRDGKLPVFSTSVNAFMYIKNSVGRCTKLTTGQTFYKLYKVFKSSMSKYAGTLKGKLPNPINIGGTKQQYKIQEDEEVSICYVINTAEYCAETLPQLEEMIRSKIDDSYKESIDFVPEQSLFEDAIMQAIRVLHLGLETRLEPAFKGMSILNWGECESVGEESGYIRTIQETITQYVPAVRNLLSSIYFKVFCDKFATNFLPAYLSILLRQKRINEMGTQQLLLDVYNLKTLMLRLPVLGMHGGVNDADIPPIPMAYSKSVATHMGKIEMVLKLIGTPEEMLVERFRIMWPDGSGPDLQNIMNLKGMKKAKQVSILEMLGLDTTTINMTSQEGVSLGFSGGTLGGSTENTQNIASKMENSMRNMTSNLQKLSFR